MLLPFGVLVSTVKACPYCNIHNHLSGTASTATNIFVGKTVKRIADDEFEVEVIRSIAGKLKAKQKVRVNQWVDKEDSGKPLLFSLGATTFPDFPVLPPEFENEMAFLTKVMKPVAPKSKAKAKPSDDEEADLKVRREISSYKVSGVKEAIQLAQGVSNESRDVGMDYLHEAKDFPVKDMVEAIRATRQRALADGAHSWDNYRLACLIEALFVGKKPEVEAYARESVKEYLKSGAGEINWKNDKYTAGPNAQYLVSMIGACGTNWIKNQFAGYRNPHRVLRGKLQEDFRNELLRAISSEKGLKLAEITYALLEAKSATIEEIAPLAKEADGKNAVALGMIWYVQEMPSMTASKQAVEALSKIEPLISEPELTKRLTEMVNHHQRWLDRKKR